MSWIGGLALLALGLQWLWLGSPWSVWPLVFGASFIGLGGLGPLWQLFARGLHWSLWEKPEGAE